MKYFPTPAGYLPIRDYAAMHGLTRATVSARCVLGYLPYQRVAGHIYIPINAPPPTQKLKRGQKKTTAIRAS